MVGTVHTPQTSGVDIEKLKATNTDFQVYIDPQVSQKYQNEKRAPISVQRLCELISQNRSFDHVTLLIISFNSVWIGVDLEHNRASMWTDAKLVFKVADNFFCGYFTFELLVRFGAFRNKFDIRKDRPFIFDALLVLLMITETWILVGLSELGSSGFSSDGMRQFGVLRLLRLLRLTRMWRLMRTMPELLAVAKGLWRALRSVAVTFFVLLLLMWVFAIIFTMQYRDATGELHTEYFARLGISMVTLFINGTLLDEFTSVAFLLKEDSSILMCAFFLFMFLSCLTTLNMLIGVLAEVIGKTTEEETANLALYSVETELRNIFAVTDTDGNMSIDCNEFKALLESKNPAFKKAFEKVGIEEDRLKDLWRTLFDIPPANSESLFQQPVKSAWAASKQLSFKDFMDELVFLKARGALNVRELSALRRASSHVSKTARDGLEYARRELNRIADMCVNANLLQWRGSGDIPDRKPFSNGQRGDGPALVTKPTKLSNVPTEMLINELTTRLASKR